MKLLIMQFFQYKCLKCVHLFSDILFTDFIALDIFSIFYIL
jgi:hypothetical protein